VSSDLRGLSVVGRFPKEFRPLTASCSFALVSDKVVYVEEAQRNVLRVLYQEQLTGGRALAVVLRGKVADAATTLGTHQCQRSSILLLGHGFDVIPDILHGKILRMMIVVFSSIPQDCLAFHCFSLCAVAFFGGIGYNDEKKTERGRASCCTTINLPLPMTAAASLAGSASRIGRRYRENWSRC
jgi:hypothetical protein